MFTCFAEVEFGVESFVRLTEIIFDFMPSSIEVIEPGELRMGMGDATSFLNTLTGRLHRYDEIAKLAQMRNQQLVQKMQMMEQELMKRDAKPGKKKAGAARGIPSKVGTPRQVPSEEGSKKVPSSSGKKSAKKKVGSKKKSTKKKSVKKK
jgi:hypothetical protein